MEPDFALPTLCLRIVSVTWDSDELVVRLLPEGPHDSALRAFELKAEGLRNALAVRDALCSLRDDEGDFNYVYVLARNNRIVLATEGTMEVELDADRVTGSFAEPTSAEFRTALSNALALKDSLDEHMRRTVRAIDRTSSMIQQQLRRIEAKANGHEAGTAAVLYEQHRRFLERALASLDTTRQQESE